MSESPGYPSATEVKLECNRSEDVMKNCLVVDDSSVIRKVARRILEGLEFKIAEAEDGEQALEACRRQMPDAVLLDWNMPRMDGYEFLRCCAACRTGIARKSCSAPARTTSRTSPARCTQEPMSTS